MSEVKVDFFRVKMPPNAAVRFESIVSQVAEQPLNESRNETIRSCPVRLQKAKETPDGWEGHLVKIRMKDLPAKASLSGELKSFSLKDDEGVGEETAFLYHPPLQVLMIQRTRSGPSASALAEYFQIKAALNGPILFEPIIRLDAMKRLLAIKEARKVEIGFAGPTNFSQFKDSLDSVSGVLDTLDQFKAPSASLTMSMGHQRGSLLVSRIVRLAKKVIGDASSGDEPVTKIEVSGLTEDDEMSVLDLLSYRMVERVADITSDDDRRISYKERRDAIRVAWKRQKNELSNLFE